MCVCVCWESGGDVGRGNYSGSNVGLVGNILTTEDCRLVEDSAQQNQVTQTMYMYNRAVHCKRESSFSLKGF